MMQTPSPMLAQLPQGDSGPASPASGNPGIMAAEMAKVREAVHLLEMALPKLEMGSDVYKAVVDSVQKLAKALPAASEVPGIQKTALSDLAQRAQQTAMLQQLQQQAAQKSQAAQGSPQAPMGEGM